MMSNLPTKPYLTLAAARVIAAAAEAEAQRNQWAVAIAIVDDAGRLLYFQRMDHTPNASVDVAIKKATHAVNYRRSTKFHEDRLQEGLQVVLSLPNALPLEGGLPITVATMVVGAIGVSGVQSPQDGIIAQAGLTALEQWLTP